jgi:NodT family efflux transporter outer membrane factor (OMF) lipoprotein
MNYHFSCVLTVIVAAIVCLMPVKSVCQTVEDNLPASWLEITPLDTVVITSTGATSLWGDSTVPTAIDSEWWREFDDSLLDSLMSVGIANNYNIAMAARRAQIARNAMLSARGAWFPSVALSAGWNRAQTGGLVSKPYGSGVGESYFTAGLSASWEVDIFGKIADNVKSQRGAWRASRAEAAGVMLSVCAQIASTYMNLRMLQQQLQVARRHAERQLVIVKIAETRYETGLAAKLDVVQAYEVYYSTTASIPKLENSIHTTINALAVLVDMSLPEAQALLSPAGSLPGYIHLISAGVPMELLRRRPDIAQAEMQLEQYAAAVGVAKKDFLPTVTLKGTIGTEAHSAGDMFQRHSLVYTVAPTLSWTLFDGLTRKYALDTARETLREGIENYNLTVATAVQETDNALSTYFSSLRYVDALQKVLDQNVEELALAIDRYKNSLNPMSDVVTAQLNSLTAENQIITAKGAALSALISLYEALGGGFDISSLN